jgi:hypothetical protein
VPRHPTENSLPARLILAAIVFALASPGIARAADSPAPAPPSLHERIDALVESGGAGPVGPLASDADFLRRAYLDLNGTIPDAATARAFLDDPAANKREVLIDRLLARPQFARHMSRVFDVMLMERRPEKSIPVAEWQAYLHKSFAGGKPLDQLLREILGADGADPATRPAARFYLDREADANLLARDVGRLFFGRDMQCAQCHDHPLVDDYLQSDYYGLLAFVNRGVLFTDKDKKVFYAETADGEVNYKSVFTGDARDHVVPKLPQGAPVSEPLLNPEEQYVVAPDKEVRPVPKYSRRAQLSATATSGTSAAFNCNWANRLWSLLLGRGLVHPLDMHHSGNPAVQSQLLALLTDELARMKFDTKAFVRELALTRAYQRSSEMPRPADMQVDVAALSGTLATWNATAQSLAAEIEKFQATSTQAGTEVSAAYAAFSKSAAAREAAQKPRAEAKKASDAIAVALAAGIKDVAAKEDVLKALVEARDKAKAAVAKLPDDKPLAEAAGQFASRTEQIDGQLTAARKLVADETAEVQPASLRLAEAEKPVQTASAEMTVARAALDVAEAKAREALDKLRTAKADHRELTARIADAQAALDVQALAAAVITSRSTAQSAGEQLAATRSQLATTAEQLAAAETTAKTATEKSVADQAALDAAWVALVDRATTRFTLAPLKSLSPEQLSFATMQGLGLVDAQVAALEPQATKDVEAMANLLPNARPREVARLLEERVDEKLRGNISPFVSLFGQQPGQAPTFQATVHQALFLANGGVLAGWLNPGGNNLSERVAKIAEPAAVADELYLSLLTRRPTADEQAQVAAYWEAGKADRAAAAREMIWSLVTSAEFRFNH